MRSRLWLDKMETTNKIEYDSFGDEDDDDDDEDSAVKYNVYRDRKSTEEKKTKYKQISGKHFMQTVCFEYLFRHIAFLLSKCENICRCECAVFLLVRFFFWFYKILI